MITRIDDNQLPEYRRQFSSTVRDIFPILCYAPDETVSFIQKYEAQSDGINCIVEDAQERRTFCHYTVESPEAWLIHYVIPSVWEDRYTMVQDAIQQIKEEFLATNSEHQLRLDIDEKVPSHNAYYGGLLASLDFELKPRVTMRAEQDLVDQLALPKMPNDVHEQFYDQTRIEDYVELYFQANSVHVPDASDEEVTYARGFCRRYIDDVCESDNMVKTFTTLEHKGEIIGIAFGGLWGNEMSLEELAILPEYYGQGLGRYLAIRCMQRMRECFGGDDKYFEVGTFRTNTRALKLYHRLGFTIDRVHLYASLTNYKLDKSG